MEINWHITTDDEAFVKAILEQQHETELVRGRYKWNLAETKEPLTMERFWREMVCSRLTTLASGSPLDKFEQLASGSGFPLAYERMCNQQGREAFILSTLNSHQVGTHRQKISKELAANFDLLQRGEWRHTIDQCNRLISLVERKTEAEVADYINDKFKGFGPKQSRNLLQELGLTRYEIPIDNRVQKWLNDELKFPFKVTPKALSDKHYYGLILDAVCTLCERCNTFPCVLDAAIWSLGN